MSTESSRNSHLSAVKTVQFHLSNAHLLILAPKSSGGSKNYLYIRNNCAESTIQLHFRSANLPRGGSNFKALLHFGSLWNFNTLDKFVPPITTIIHTSDVYNRLVPIDLEPHVAVTEYFADDLSTTYYPEACVAVCKQRGKVSTVNVFCVIPLVDLI